jgi:hypothetical protein
MIIRMTMTERRWQRNFRLGRFPSDPPLASTSIPTSSWSFVFAFIVEAEASRIVLEVCTGCLYLFCSHSLLVGESCGTVVPISFQGVPGLLANQVLDKEGDLGILAAAVVVGVGVCRP